MTDIALTIVRGDSKIIPFQVTDENGAPIDITGCVAKLSIKESFEASNADALVFKTTYDPAQFEITDAVNGFLSAKLRKPDTIAAKIKSYFIDVELTMRGPANGPGSVGTATVTAGSGIVVGAGTDFTKFEVGDIVVVGVKVVTVVSIEDATHFTTDFKDWSPASGLSLSVFDGDVKTIANGTIEVTRDVTR